MSDVLNDHDLGTSTAKKLRDYFEERLATHRAKNDSAPLERTEKLRGQIAETKHILNLLEKSQRFVIESSDSE